MDTKSEFDAETSARLRRLHDMDIKSKFDAETSARLREVFDDFEKIYVSDWEGLDTSVFSDLLTRLRSAIPFVDHYLDDNYDPYLDTWEGVSFWKGYFHTGSRVALRFAHSLEELAHLGGPLPGESENSTAIVDAMHHVARLRTYLSQ